MVRPESRNSTKVRISNEAKEHAMIYSTGLCRRRPCRELDKSAVQGISRSREDVPFRHRRRIPPRSVLRQALTSSCLADRGRYGPPVCKRRGLPDTTRSSRRPRPASPGIVPIGEIEKTLFGERICILGQIASKHRPLPEKLSIHDTPTQQCPALQDT